MNYIKTITIEGNEARQIESCLDNNYRDRDLDGVYEVEWNNGARIKLHLWGLEDEDDDTASPGVIGSFVSPGGQWTDTDEEDSFFGLWSFPDGDDRYYVYVYCNDSNIKVNMNEVYMM